MNLATDMMTVFPQTGLKADQGETTMKDSEKWAAYDKACWTLGPLVGRYSARIDQEEEKESPDQEAVERWVEEQFALMRLKESLSIKDMATIEHVNKTYDLIARDVMSKA